MNLPKKHENTGAIFRVLKVIAGLVLLMLKYYSLAWFYIPRGILSEVDAPQTLDELEYQAKTNPAFLVFIAFVAIAATCFVSFILYIWPALTIAKFFLGGAA